MLASALAWAASYFVVDLSVEFLKLWPEQPSQQFLGLVAWYAVVGLPLVGGAIAVLSPAFGGIVLAAAVALWVWHGIAFSTGPGPQLALPLIVAGIAALGAIAAFAATIRGVFRRRAERRRTYTQEELEREEALRLDPSEDLLREVDLRTQPADDLRRLSDPDAIVPVALRRPEGPPSGLNGLVVVNALLLAVLTVAVGVLLYSTYRNGELERAFSSLPFAQSAAEPTQVAVAIEVPADPAVETAAPDDVETASVPDPVDVAALETGTATDALEPMGTEMAAAPDPEPEMRISTLPLDLTAMPVNEWSDPFDYCAAVGTIDFPDSRYTGPAVGRAIADALRVPIASSPDRVRWRCVDGAVLGCASFRGPSCAMTPSVAEMVEFCVRNPNAKDLLAPNGTWSCAEGAPQIPQGQPWPVDSRGFLPGAWAAIPRPQDAQN